MSVKKRRKLPEEDLAAAVADIINSPITRSNLSFLRPAASTPAPDTTTPPGDIATPTGFSATEVEPDPGDYASPPMGVVWRPTSPTRALWQAEGLGSIFEQSRVRRIQQAQDALSLVEEKVYDLLWGTKNQRKDEFRLVHYSLQRIATDARINIKTVRELLPRLIDKGFIQVAHEADVRRNIPTLYRVASYGSVLQDQRQRNRFYVAKTGKGVFYVHPVSASFDAIPAGPVLEPIPMGVDTRGSVPAPSGSDAWPDGTAPSGPEGLDDPKPMASGGAPSLDSYLDKFLRQTTFALLATSVKESLGLEPDHALLKSLIVACHRNAIETTGEAASDDELLYFTSTKAKILSRAPNIRNHLAVLRKAVPECFIGETFRAYRMAAEARKQRAAQDDRQTAKQRDEYESQAAQAARRYANWASISERHRDDRGYDMKAIADDPELDDLGRRQAEGMLLRIGRFTRSGL